MKIARVFPRKTKMTPDDDDAYIGSPPFFWGRKYDEIHISTTFSWDIPRSKQLAREWSVYGKVLIGGPAFGDPGNSFTPGMYIKKGVVFTSRGCPNSCWYCLVPKREGQIKELSITEGNIIQDNNLLACSEKHIDKVFEMLKTQKRIEFSGGFESRRVTPEITRKLSELNIRHIWLSYDCWVNQDSLREAVRNLSPYFKRHQIRCYVLIGFESDRLECAEARLKMAWSIGTLPFAMRHRLPAQNFADSFVYKERAWNLLAHNWSRPAIIKAIMQKS